MTDNRQSAEKTEKAGPSQGNLGQKQAEREEIADEKLEHMSDTQSARGERPKSHKSGTKS